MGALLPAIAAACDGQDNPHSRALRAGSSGRLSYTDIARVHKDDAGLLKVGD